MAPVHRSRRARDESPAPEPGTTVAAAFSPPAPGRRAVPLFVAVTLAVVCGVAGVLLPFTEIPAAWSVLLLAVAVLAGGWAVVALRRPGG